MARTERDADSWPPDGREARPPDDRDARPPDGRDAQLPGRRDAQPPEVDRLLPGRFAMGGDYATRRPHGTSDWLLILTVDGSGRIGVRSGPDLVVGRHSVVSLAPRTPHDYGTAPEAEGWELLWVHLHPRPSWLGLLDWPQAAPGVRRLDLSPEVAGRVAAALSRAVTFHHGRMRNAALFGMNAVEEALLWCDMQRPHGDRLDPRVLAVVEHVSARLDAPHSVPSLAAVAGVSASRLSRLFARHLRLGVMAYVEQQRIAAARELLEVSSFAVAHVAQRVGYPDPLYFSRRFRRLVGQSPTEYRAAHGES
ncbi:helix-turn-helix domain-containing protein [Streptomyces sp. NPDC050658]|uniref:helix-turn-helix domain-containing protein n=1 Tax=unclassified Streptomyces TaxID=2593676 RepID=UPI003437D34E